MNVKKLTWLATLALAGMVALFALAGTALASNTSHAKANASMSLYRPFPNGINPNNAALAWQQVSGRAAWDDQYASVIASQTGATAYVASQYKVVGYGNGMPGTTNSALSGAGAVVPLADHGGSGSVKVLIVMNIATSKTVAFMVRCGNPRLNKTPYVAPIPWRNFSKGTVLRIHRTVTKPVQLVCPSGQTVSGTLEATLNEVIHGTTWGKVQGSLVEKLQLKLQAQLTVLAKLKCGAAPPPVNIPVPVPTPQPQPTPPIIVVVVTPTCVGANACSNNPPAPTPTPSPTGSGICTNLSLSASNLTVNATASFSVNNATFKDAAFNWGDGNTTGPQASTSATHSYATAGSKTVVATLEFNIPGGVQPSTCQASITVSAPLPTTFVATGSTSVQGSKSLPQPCPPPNQAIVKTGTSDVITLTSPTFTGHGATQADANTDLSNQEIAWKNANQPVVDAQALAQAQQRLSAALLTCPAPAPPPTMLINNCNQPQEDAVGQEYANLYCDVTSPKGDTITVVFSSHYGHFTCPGSKTFTSAGYDRVYTPCNYVAPTEIPPGGNDTYTVTVTDITNSAVVPVSATTSFPIHNPDVHP